MNASVRHVVLLVIQTKAMLSRITISLVLAAALVSAPMCVSARPCILSNASNPKACQSDCCANKTCCATSPKNTAPIAQPLAKSGSNQQNIVTLPAVFSVAVDQPALESPVFQSAECTAHSPPTLALICIRLI